MQKHDAVIIGAGPAGTTAAILLSQAGWNVAVIEKKRFPRQKVCGECVAASNLPLFDALGIGPQVETLAGPKLRQVALMVGEASIQADLPPLRDAQHHWGRAIGREHLDTLLLERARQAGATVLQPWTVKSVMRRPEGFHCFAATAEAGVNVVLAAPILIDAHGSWEPFTGGDRVERRLPRASDLFAFKADFHDTTLKAGVLPVIAFPGGYGGMVLGNSGVTTLACCIRRDRLTACRNEHPGQRAGDAVEAYLKASCAGVRDALLGSRRLHPWLSVGPIRPGVRMPVGGSDIFQVGNAAGEAHPIIGEGISMAMQSSALLCEKLINGRTLHPAGAWQHQVQREYAHAWRRHFAGRIRLSALFAHLAMRPGMASGLLPLFQAWPAALTHAARLSGKVRQATNSGVRQAAI